MGPARPTPLITPADGGRLMTQSSSDTAGLHNYVEKVNFRREGDVEVRREGWTLFPAQIFDNYSLLMSEGSGDTLTATMTIVSPEWSLAGGTEGDDTVEAFFGPSPPPPDFFTNDYSTLSGVLVSTTPALVIVAGEAAFVDGADGVAVGPVVSTAGISAASYTLVIVAGASTNYVDGADGAAIGPVVSTAGVSAASYTLIIVTGASTSFVDGADGAAVGPVVSTAGVSAASYDLVIVVGDPSFVDGADGVAVGPVVSSAGISAAVYAPA